MTAPIHMDLKPLTQADIPDPSSPEFQQFLDAHFEAGRKIAESMDAWSKNSTKVHGTVQIVTLPSGKIRKDLNVDDHWCGRISSHDLDSFSVSSESKSGQLQAASSQGVYERFRQGLFVDHSEHEKEYIEACKEAQRLQVYEADVAEVWRMTYVTPPPTSPRTFVFLLLNREVNTTSGQRMFLNISLPFSHPDCPEKQGNESSRVRGRYVSVEAVREVDNGSKVEWRMATSSDAGGNIPRFVTNKSLPASISEDVPSFLEWASKQEPAEQSAATREEVPEGRVEGSEPRLGEPVVTAPE